MPTKSLSIYNSEDFTVDNSDQLVVEFGRSHMALLACRGSRKSIAAFELFTFADKKPEDLKKVFHFISLNSKLMNNNASATKIFINTEFCIPVPIFKFNKEIAVDYLNLVCGEDHQAKVHFEHLPIEPGIMNVFRVDDNWRNHISENFNKVTFHHTYSNIIKGLRGIDDLPASFISVNFYNTFFTAVVMKDGKFNLIQSFVYGNSEDVLYHLLNVATQFQLVSDEIILQISGLVDLDFKLYRDLIRYFKNVQVAKIESSDPALQIQDHPLHYYTPFFNLVK